MIWSSCLMPVPAILNLPLSPRLDAPSTYSFAVLYGDSALTHSTNSSSAEHRRPGVRSFQLNGTPVASGVVNRFDSVMTILCGSPLAFLDVEEAFAPAPPGLVDDDERLLHQVVLGDDAFAGEAAPSGSLPCRRCRRGRTNSTLPARPPTRPARGSRRRKRSGGERGRDSGP